MDTLCDLIGDTTIDHSAFIIRTGKYEEAKEFFINQLCWKLIKEISGDDDGGWKTFFARPYDKVSEIQFNEENDFLEASVFPGTHLGILVQDVQVSAKEISDYFKKLGFCCKVSKANKNGTKLFLRIPEIFAFELELV